ncbi:MAG: polysaccharide deacetylase family protein [Chthoniobacterales bacterium]
MKTLLHQTSLLAVLFFLGACQAVHTQSPEPAQTPEVTSGTQKPSLSGQFTLDSNSLPTGNNNQPISQTPTLEEPLQLPAPPTPIPTPKKPAPPRLSYNNIETSRRVVALTFDDGPHAQLTPKLLDLLKKENVKATFYLVGKNAQAYPAIVKRIAEEGHELGNHSWSHPALNRLGANGVKSQMDRTTRAIQKASGVTVKTMRPPYGATNSRLNRRLNEEFGLKVIMWSVDPLDWKYRNSKRVANSILTKTKPGDIILVHDIHPSSVAAMSAVISGLKKRGYHFATVSELIALEGAPAEAPQTTPAASAPSPSPSASPDPSPGQPNIPPGTIQSQRPANEF